MKTYFKKIIALTLMLSVTLGTALSLSSCSYAVGFFGEVLGSLGGDVDGGTGDDGSDGESLTAQRSSLLSSVAIIASFDVQSDPLYPSASDSKSLAGSGVIYKLDKSTGDAYIITNYHVVYYSKSVTDDKISDDIKLYLYGLEVENYAIAAEYVGGSMNYDIAVLKVTNSDILRDMPVCEARLSDSEPLRALDPVIAIGNAEGEGFSATKGYISVPSEYLEMKAPDNITNLNIRVIRVDAAINEGNSGGGLFDTEGRLVGIVNAKKIGERVDNIGYAIPINLAVAVAENIIYHSELGRAELCHYMLDFTTKEAEIVISLDENGEIVRAARVAVTKVPDTSAVFGQIAVGDTILKIIVDGNETEVKTVYHMNEATIWARPGSTVTVHFERGGNNYTATVTVSAEMGVIQ